MIALETINAQKRIDIINKSINFYNIRTDVPEYIKEQFKRQLERDIEELDKIKQDYPELFI